MSQPSREDELSSQRENLLKGFDGYYEELKLYADDWSNEDLEAALSDPLAAEEMLEESKKKEMMTNHQGDNME